MSELQRNACTMKKTFTRMLLRTTKKYESSVLQVNRLDLDQHKAQSINFCASSSAGKVQSITELGLFVLWTFNRLFRASGRKEYNKF